LFPARDLLLQTEEDSHVMPSALLNHSPFWGKGEIYFFCQGKRLKIPRPQGCAGSSPALAPSIATKNWLLPDFAKVSFHFYLYLYFN